jgi:hypothetical protein
MGVVAVDWLALGGVGRVFNKAGRLEATVESILRDTVEQSVVVRAEEHERRDRPPTEFALGRLRNDVTRLGVDCSMPHLHLHFSLPLPHGSLRCNVALFLLLPHQ